jgi:hypothetical protein
MAQLHVFDAIGGDPRERVLAAALTAIARPRASSGEAERPPPAGRDDVKEARAPSAQPLFVAAPPTYDCA